MLSSTFPPSTNPKILGLYFFLPKIADFNLFGEDEVKKKEEDSALSPSFCVLSHGDEPCKDIVNPPQETAPSMYKHLLPVLYYASVSGSQAPIDVQFKLAGTRDFAYATGNINNFFGLLTYALLVKLS
nr:hypothetical protein Iba_chr05aCG1180 [Ipomoea batatas]